MSYESSGSVEAKAEGTGTPPSSAHADILEQARKRMRLAIEAASTNREYQVDDIKFAAGSPDNQYQWPQEVVALRAAKDGSPSRPTLTINKLTQHIKLVTNEQRQNRPAMKVLPVDDKGDTDLAEVLNGIIRHIEANSDADIAYDTAGENQVIIGEGYWRILTDYCDEMSFDQDIFIKPIKNSFSVYMDPDGLKKDATGRYIEWCFITDELSKTEFKKQFPKAAETDWDLLGKGDGASDWLTGENVRIAEYFCFHEKKKKIALWADGSTTADGEMPKVAGMMPAVGSDGKPVTRETSIRTVKWSKITGFEVLEEKEWAGKYIPVVRVVGEEVEVDGKVIVNGQVRKAKDAQRMFNYWVSQEAEILALAPKAPITAPAEAIEGYESFYKTANTTNHSYLPYNAYMDDGVTPIPRPERMIPPQPSRGILEAKLGAADDLQSTMGQYNPSLGAEAKEKSGKAIQARQRQADVGTFHYIDNLGRSIRQTGRIVIDLIPKIYDTKRVARIIGEDGEPDHVTIDPEQQQPVLEMTGQDGAIEKIYNPSIGQYDVRVTVGPSYTTKRQEAAEFMATVLQGNKELMAVMGDLYFRMLDVPGAEDIADRLKKTLPPNLADDDEDAEPMPMVQTPQGPLPIDGASQLIAQQMQQIEEMSGAMQKVQTEGKAVEAGKAELDRREAGLKNLQDSIRASEQMLALKEQLAQKTLEAEDARTEAERTKIIADMKMLVNDAVTRLEGMKQEAEEVKAGEDQAKVEQQNQESAVKNQNVEKMQGELLNALQQAIAALSAPRRTTLEMGAGGMPEAAVSEVVQ